MLYKIRIFGIGFFFSLLMSCGGSKGTKSDGDLPVWVNNYKTEYPDISYISSLGVSEYKSMAEKKAYQGIASAFEVQIKSTEDSKEVTFEDKNSFSQTYSEVFNINTEIDQSLINVDISESFFDQKNNKYYVLATLNKAETSMMYRQERSEILAEAEDVYYKSAKEDDILLRLALLSKSIFKLEEVERLENKIRVLDNVGGWPQKFRSIHDLTLEREYILQNMKVYIDMQDDKIFRELSREFNELGLKITSDMSESVLKVMYNFDKERSGVVNSDAKFINWNISVKLIRTKNELTYGTYTAKGRSGQLNYTAAEERAYYDVSKKLEEEFKAFLVKSILRVDN